MRAALLALLAGLLASAGWIAMAAAQADVMPSYLAAWLFWIAVPMGALPVVMALEALGASEWGMLPVLRRALLLLPAGSVFAIPVLMRTQTLFRRPGVADPLPADWMAPGFFIGRAIVILVVLSLLAVLFSRTPGAPRRGIAVLGLLLHVSLASVAAVDWVMALQPGLGSSGFGLLLISSQIGVAACLAAFLLAVRTRGVLLPQGLGVLLAVLLAGWGFLHFTQYLVVWSANLPKEITWYQARTPGFGIPMVWFAIAATLIAVATLPSGLARIPAVMASLAAMLLLVHLGETIWLVVPAFRGAFGLSLPDFLAVIGLGGLLCTLLLAEPDTRRRTHAAV